MITRFPLKSLSLSVSLFSLLVFGGCAKYRPKPLQESLGFVKKERNIEVAVRKLSGMEVKRCFGKRVARKGYNVIQLCVANHGETPFVLDGSDISLGLESTYRVAKNLHFHTTRRVVGWGIGGLFLWPLLIPAVVDGLGANSANKRMDRDFEMRVIGSDSIITVHPGKRVNRVMFVHRDNMRSNFSLTLKNKRYLRDFVTFDLQV